MAKELSLAPSESAGMDLSSTKRALTTISRVISLISGIVDSTTIVTYSLLVGLVVLDVILRSAFNSPLPWGNEVSGFILIMAIFAPCARCEENNAHIRLDFMDSKLGRTGKLVLNIVIQALAAVWMGFVSITTIMEVPSMMATRETGIEFQYPLWPLRLLVGLMTFLLLLRLCVNLVSLLATGKKGESHD